MATYPFELELEFFPTEYDCLNDPFSLVFRPINLSMAITCFSHMLLFTTLSGKY